MALQVKNWRVFQHYKDRSPPWIKLQKSLLDDYDFQCLPIASKALAPMLWLLASESDDGSITSEVTKLAFRLRWPEKDVRAGLTPLIQKGFLLDASASLAGCKQAATSETETETETEGEGERVPTEPVPQKRDDPVARVFDHWRLVHNHPRAGLDKKRRKVIADRLKDYSEADLCLCISGYLNSPHHMGQNERATVYDSLEVFLRDASHVDAGIKFAAAPPRTDLSSTTRRNVAAVADWIPPEARHAAE